MGKVERCHELYAQALVSARQRGDLRAESAALSGLALALQTLGKTGEAQVLYEASLDRGRQTGDRRSIGITCAHLAELHLLEGRFDEARQYHAQALDFTIEPRIRAVLQTGIARLERRCGRVNAARDILLEAEAVLRSLKDDQYLIQALCERGHLALCEARIDQLAEAEALRLVSDPALGFQSAMGRRFRSLQQACAAFEAGERHRLFRGELWADLPPGLQARLAAERPAADAPGPPEASDASGSEQRERTPRPCI
jgi:tetratricopeptide (TPR) repeat protein